MNHLLLASFLVLLTTLGEAQPDYAATDRWVESYHATSNDPDSIALDLIAYASNDFEKVRAIYQFLVHHISYDHAVAQRGIRRINHSNQDILKRRRAICWGYAQLMTHMCQRIGLEAFTVSGYSRMDDGGGNTFKKPDHAWNIIRIKDDFYPVDATWASNVTEKADHYFLTDPSLFGKDHYPTMRMWQLLDCPRTFEAFKAGAARPSHDRLDCYPNFKDSIEQFIALPYIDRRLLEERKGFVDNPTDENSRSYAHAVIDKAITLKEQADSLADGGSMKSAVPIYQAAIERFEQAKTVADLFPWQQEALGFAYFNLAQGLYQQQYSRSRRKYPEVRAALNQAKRLLLELDSPSWSIQNALQHIDKNLALIH